MQRIEPAISKNYEGFKSKGFEILGVSMDSNMEFWAQAVQFDKLPWPNVSDLKEWHNMAALIYGVSYMPTNFLIDANGTIIAKDLDAVALSDKLDKLLK